MVGGMGCAVGVSGAGGRGVGRKVLADLNDEEN